MNISRYAKKFLDELYLQTDKYYNISKLTDNDKQIIDTVLSYEYSYLFYKYYHPKKSKIIYNPELATDFNIFLSDLFLDCIRIVFLCDVEIAPDKKQAVFRKLITSIENYILDIKESSPAEVILYIKKKLRKNFKEIYSNSSIEMNSHRSLVSYLNNKFTGSHSLKSHYDKLSKEINKNFPRNILFIFLTAVFLLIMLINCHIENFYIALFIMTIGIITPIYCYNTLNKIDKKLKLLKTPNDIFKTYERLGVDVIKLEISQNLVSDIGDIAKPIIAIIRDVRLELTDEYGFVMPSIHILDNTKIKSGIKFFIRGNEVDFLEIDYENVEFPIEEFRNKLKSIVLNNIDKVFTIQEAAMMLELNVLINGRKNDVLENKIDIYDIREIFVKIIQKGGKLTDFLYIYERINHYSKTTKNTDEIAELVYSDIKNYVAD